MPIAYPLIKLIVLSISDRHASEIPHGADGVRVVHFDNGHGLSLWHRHSGG